MKLQTNITIKKQPDNNQLDYDSEIVLFGSCFSEHIGEKLNYFKFKHTINPFGILFHPKAIEQLISRALQDEFYDEEDLIFNNEQWHCFNAHSKLSNTSKKALLNNLNNQLKLTKSKLKTANYITITLGTAWVYTHLKTKNTVANCHKIPQQEFKKHLLSITTIQKSLENIISKIASINTKVKIIFTVSPVRHLKDGFIENTRSKSHLISAIHNVISNKNDTALYYFPSFEILMDELRDYRFYNQDMLHPNTTAINYIWNYFKTVWIHQKAYITMDDVAYIQQGLNHKPFNKNSKAHQKFMTTLESKKDALKQTHPHIQF